MKRFNHSRRCPICSGYDGAERGTGKRCYGFLSDDGEWAHCTREEHAGSIEKNASSDTYAHKLVGSCKCGKQHDNSPVKQIVATYNYSDESGELLYQVVRFEPKDFCQRRSDGQGDWTWKLENVRRVPYRLRQLLAADPQATVFIVEGEKDADRLAALGLVATTNASGAGKWRDEYNEHLRGRRVCILPDNDDAGREHALMVSGSLQGVAANVKVVGLPNLPDKGDVSDWLKAGGTVEHLLGLAESTAPLTSQPVNPQNISESNAETHEEDKASRSNNADDDIDVCMADVEPEEVEWLIKPFIPLGKLTIVEGDPDEGKSFATLAIVAALTNGSDLPFAKVGDVGNVLLLSAEDGRADTIRPRLDTLGADVNRVFAVTIPLALDDKGIEQLERLIIKRQVKLVIFDPLFAYVGGHTDINQDNKVRAITSRLADIAEKTRCAIVALRHLSKAQQRNAKSAGSSSIAWTAAARSVLLFGHEPDDEQARGFVHTKHNLSKAGTAQGYRIDDVNGKPHFNWTGECDLTSDKILGSQNYNGNGSATSKVDEAVEFLRDVLEHGEQPKKEIAKRAGKERISEATLRRAKDKLKVIPYRPQSSNGAWWWKLPDVLTNEPDAQKAGHPNEHVAVGQEVQVNEPLSGTMPDAQVSMWDDGDDNARCSNEHVDDQPQTIHSYSLTPLIPDAQTGSPEAVEHVEVCTLQSLPMRTEIEQSAP